MRFTLTVNMENAAFREDDDSMERGAQLADGTYAAGYVEVARILREVATNVAACGLGGPCVDANGNTAGRWSMYEDVPLADELETLAQNEYMIDGHYLPTGQAMRDLAALLRK